jgi:hypothetical protein
MLLGQSTVSQPRKNCRTATSRQNMDNTMPQKFEAHRSNWVLFDLVGELIKAGRVYEGAGCFEKS